MSAFRATYADLKLIKTRQCVQIIFEVPQNEFDAAYEVLGGLPNPAAERWFGFAAIVRPAEKETVDHPNAAPQAMPQQGSDKPPAGAKRPWREIDPVTQCAIRCDDPIFVTFLKESHPEEWRETGDAAACVRFMFSINSRSEIGKNHKAKVAWHQLDDEFGAWKALERA